MVIVKNWVVRVTNTDKGAYSDMSFKTRREARDHTKAVKPMLTNCPILRVDMYKTLSAYRKNTISTDFIKAR